MPTLKVTYADQTELDITVTTAHTVQVLTPDNRVESAFSFAGVTAVGFDQNDPAPVVEAAPVLDVVEDAPTPAPDPEPTPAVEPEPQPVDDAGAAIPTPEPTVVEQPAPAPAPAPKTDPTEAAVPAPVDPETVTADDTDPHTTAVLSAIGTLDNAIAVAGDVSNDETTVSAHVAQAQADIAELLTQYPDSAPLQDAKSQIDALAENFTLPPAA